ncbi:MAG: alpha-L-fucosidase [Thalassotalea sp.]|nr:alpha-L-fucosidase [Thalassotalea sp.]MDG2393494.1 alpha-L-fucosidase [Thalassotalea sp.]
MNSLAQMISLFLLLSIALSNQAQASAKMHDDGITFPYSPPSNHTKTLAKIDPEYLPYMQAQPEMIAAWQDDKFGFFICFDHSSQNEISMSWGRHGPRPHHSSDGKVTKGMPEQAYNDQAKTLNPVDFDASEWLDVVEDSGAKYIVFTAKHHAGFSMWDSKVTDFDIMNTPYGKDMTKSLVAEAQKRGIKFYFYYSQPDWYHPLYRDIKDREKYLREFMYPQLRELVTQYGKIDGLWFDGLGKNINTWHGAEMVTMLRKIQPHLVINHRWANPVNRMGDFDGPERMVGRFQINRPWESCTVIGGGWAWTGDTPPMSFTDAITLLTTTVSRGGNLLLNTGPDSSGVINPEHAQRYREIGQWLKSYGESVYGTRGGPYIDGTWGGSTRKGNNIYLHIYGQVGDTLNLPKLPVAIKEAKLLTGGNVAFSNSKNHLTLNFSAYPEKSDTHPTRVVKLTMASNVDKIDVITTLGELVSLSAKATSSSDKSKKFSAKSMVEGINASFSEGIMVKSSWSPNNQDKKPWIQLTLDDTQPIQSLFIGTRRFSNNIPRDILYSLKLKVDGQWQTIFENQPYNFTNGISLARTYSANAIRVEFSNFTNKNYVKVGEIKAYSVM